MEKHPLSRSRCYILALPDNAPFRSGEGDLGADHMLVLAVFREDTADPTRLDAFGVATPLEVLAPGSAVTASLRRDIGHWTTSLCFR